MGHRSRALAILGALALLAASMGAHDHAERGVSLDKTCAVCTARAQSACISEPEDLLAAPGELILPLFSPAPLALDLWTHGGAAPRGPPATA
jgi:hypothetical protein